MASRLGKREGPQDIHHDPIRKEVHTNPETNNIVQGNVVKPTSFEANLKKTNNAFMPQQGQFVLNQQDLNNMTNVQVFQQPFYNFQQNFPQDSYIMLNGGMNSMKMPPQQNYIFQQAPIQPVMMINSQPMFQNATPNFFPQQMQNTMMGGPTQTININNPQSNNMTIRSFTTGENAKPIQESQINQNHNQNYSQMMQLNPSQYYMLPGNDGMINQVNTSQAQNFQYTQPYMYMMPQMGNMQTNFPAQTMLYSGNNFMPQQSGFFFMYTDNQQQNFNVNQNQGTSEANKNSYQQN